MKKFFMALCTFAVCITTCVAFSACSKANLSYDTYYNLKSIGIMGFKGSTEDVKMYLNSVERQEEVNAYASYIDVLTRIELKFGSEGKGFICIRDIGSLDLFKPDEGTGSGGSQEEQMAKAIYDQLVKNGNIKDGSALLEFEFSQDGEDVTIELVHTTIKDMGLGVKDDGDVTFGDLLDLLTYFNMGSAEAGYTVKITNKDVNKLKAKNGTITMNIGISASWLRLNLHPDGLNDMVIIGTKPDVATNIMLTFKK